MTNTHPEIAQAPDERTSSNPTSRARISTIFAFLWGCAHVIHATHQGGDGASALTQPDLLVVLAAGLLVLLRPSSARRLTTLAGVQILAFVINYPFVPNHWTLAAFVNVGLLLSAIKAWRESQFNTGTLLSQAAPYARAVFLIAYSAAAVAKLNTTFLDPAHSCAVSFLETTHLLLGADLPTGLPAHALIWVSLVTELSVPFLLLLRRTRVVGIAIAMTFHVLLASIPGMLVMDFAIFIVALLVPFAPLDLGDRVYRDGARFSYRRPRLVESMRRRRHLLSTGAVGTVATLAILRGLAIGSERWELLIWAIFASIGLILLAVGGTILASYQREPDPSAMLLGWNRLSWFYYVLIAVLVLNVVSPYVGLKTTTSFTMFSNLHTEGEATNHLLIPRLRVAGYQDDLVEVLDASDDDFTELTEENQFLTYHELRRHLHEKPEATVRYVRDGNAYDLSDASGRSHVAELSYIERKLIHLRPVNSAGTPECQW